MLPTIVENENIGLQKDPFHANSKAPHKTDPDLPNNTTSPYRASQRHQDRSADLSKPTHKRVASPYSTVNFYPSIRCTVLPHPKLNTSIRQPDSMRGSPPTAKKKSIEEIPDQMMKLVRPIPTMVYTHQDELESQSGRKSLPSSTISHQKNISTQNNSKIARELLKAKFRGKEQPAEHIKPVTSNYHHIPVSLPGKVHPISTETNLGKGSNDLINSKSPNNIQLQDNYQRYLNLDKMKINIENRSTLTAIEDKTLLHSASKQNHKNYEPSYGSVEIDDAGLTRSHVINNKAGQSQQDVVIATLKKSTNFSPLNAGKNNGHPTAFSPVVKLLLQKNASQPSDTSKTEKKDNQRSPSLNLKHKRGQFIAISPVKKGNSIFKDKPVKQEGNVTEVKKAASVQVLLSEDEKAQYGNRCPADYEKVELLGKGGFALVWLGTCKRTGRKVALKQMSKNSSSGSDAKNDLYYGQLLFKEGGEPREEFKNYPGINHIATFIDYKSTKLDDWHIAELCGKPLSSLLFDVKGEFYKGERLYGVKYLNLHHQFRQDPSILKYFIRSMAEAMDLFSHYNIVHCDIKPENILITPTPTSNQPFQLKIIDFGSAYNWGDSGNIRMATPEYMPPEFLNALLGRNGENSIEKLAEISQAWSVDVWSLGAVLLEIITGVPLWIPLKCKVEGPTRKPLRFGLFACKGRAYDKIYLKQKALVDNFGPVLSEYLENWSEAEGLFDLLLNMLRWDPKRRFSPADILSHPYMRSA